MHSHIFSFGIGKHLVVLLTLWVAISGCCTKQGCIGADDRIEVFFYGFSKAETDSIVCFRYQKGTSLSMLVDSFRFYKSYLDSTDTVFKDAIPAFYSSSPNSSRSGPVGFDYKIRMSGSGRIFVLSNLETKQEGCNSCFPYRPASDYYPVLSAYRLDGQQRKEGSVKIYK